MGTEDDGLSWLFELDADLKGGTAFLNVLRDLNSTMKNLDAGMKKVEGSSHKAADGHKKQAHEVGGLMGVFDRLVHQGLEPFLHKAKEIAEFEFIREGAEKLLEMPERLADGVRELGVEMLRAGAAGERTQKVFNNIFGEKLGRETTDYIKDIAPHTEFTVDRLKQAALQLGRIGFKGEGLDRAIGASLDVAARTGGGEAGLSGALEDLERLKRTGRVSDRTLGGFGLGDKDFFAELTRRTGHGRKELTREMDAGILDTENALEGLYTLITKKTGKDLGGAGVDMSKLMGAKFTHLGEIPDLLFEKAAESPGWDHLTKTLGTLAQQLGPDGVLGKQLGDGVIKLFDRLGPVLDHLPDQIDKLSHSFDGMGKVISVAAQATETLFHRLEQIATLGGLLSHKQEPAGPDKSLLGRLETPGGTLDRVLHAPDRWSRLIAKKLFGIGGDAGDGLAGGILDSAGSVDKATRSAFADTPIDATTKALKVHSPSVVFEDIGAMTALGFARGVEKGRSLHRVRASAVLL